MEIEKLSVPEWLEKNEKALINMLPSEWKEITQEDAMRFGYQFKILGMDWRTPAQFGDVMEILRTSGLMMERAGFNGAIEIKANPIWVPPLEIKR